MKTKEIQGKLWSKSPQYWANYFEPFFVPMYKNVLKQLKLDTDNLLLDAGCGSGLFCNLATTSGASVIGIDAAQGLLEIARARNPKVTFLEEDLETLPFEADRFQTVTGFNSFQFAESTENALLEAKRILKKGGKLVVGIWDKPELSEATNILKSIGTLLPPPPPGTPGPFALSEDGKVESLFDSMNLKLTYKSKVACPFLYDSLSAATKSFLGTGPAAAAINNTNEELVRQTIEGALKPYQLTENMFHLQNNFLVFIGEK